MNIKRGNFKNKVGVQAFRRERERENGGFRSDFVPDIFPEGHARPGTSLLVLLIARAPFATSFATMDLFCPDRSFC